MTRDQQLDAIRETLAGRLEAARATAEAARAAATRSLGTGTALASLGTYLAREETARELANVVRTLDALRGAE